LYPLHIKFIRTIKRIGNFFAVKKIRMNRAGNSPFHPLCNGAARFGEGMVGIDCVKLPQSIEINSFHCCDYRKSINLEVCSKEFERNCAKYIPPGILDASQRTRYSPGDCVASTKLAISCPRRLNIFNDTAETVVMAYLSSV